MLTKLVFVLTLLFGVSAASIAAVRPHLPLYLRHGLKISKLSGEPLIKAACQGIGDNETESCVSTLQSAPSDQQANANSLALYTLRYVENHAETIVAGIKNFSTVPDVAPMLQSALTDCREQYTSIDDLIETATDAVERNNYADAQKFINAAISSIDVCNNQLQESSTEEQAENRQGESVDMEKELKKYNLLHRNLLNAALNILTVD
ncbi:hypothetical protein ACS0TY_007859 [Phlomoides rotata]